MEMTDNEIIKALECCLPQNGKRNCDDCPYAECEKRCADKMIKDSLDLINRQKAGIERLKRYDEERDIALHARLIANAKTEAIRAVFEWVMNNCKPNEAFEIRFKDCPYVLTMAKEREKK